MEKRERIPIIDFTEYIGINAEEFISMDDELFEWYEMYCDFIQLATAIPAGATTDSDFYCRLALEDGERCEGTIEVTQTDLPTQVRWRCKSCGNEGAIINYEGSAWDNSELSDSEKEAFLTRYSAFSGDMDYYDDMFFDFGDTPDADPLDDFEYYLNPFDPEGSRFGGPSSLVIEEMLNCDWKNPHSPIYLRDDLPYAELKQCDFFYNARQFLLTLQKSGEFELTRNQFLKRKAVSRLLDQTRWPENHVARLRKYNKHIDETDVWTLHGIRLLIDIAGLTRQTDNNKYLLNEERRDLLKEENAGKLYRTLVTAYFKEMDMAYLGTSLNIPHLQYSVPFIIYKLSLQAREWASIEELLPEILLFSVNTELGVMDEEEFDISQDILSEDLFASLGRFCLVKTRRIADPDPDEPITHPDQVCITPLLEKFIEFKVR